MFEQTKRYKHYIVFKVLDEKDVIPPYIFWLAVATLYLVCNAPKNRILIVLNTILDYLFIQNKHFESLEGVLKRFNFDLSELIASQIIIQIKELLFFLALLVLIYPIIKAIQREKTFFYKPEIKRRLWVSLGIFIILSLLIFPYSYPWGTSAMGLEYAINSTEPFAQNAGWYYRRLLMPAVAHFMHLDGLLLYYLFSIFCTYILIFMSLSFIESKTLGLGEIDNENFKRTFLYNYKIIFFYYLSIGTSSYLLHNFQHPGYTEQLFFILLLFTACIPMTRQERLSIFALSIATHEISMFVFIPIVFFCFPKLERGKSLGLMILYIFSWLVGNGFALTKAVGGQAEVGSKTGIDYWVSNPGLGLAGLFFSYKFIWLIILYVVWILWQQSEKKMVVAIVSIILFPTVTIIPSVDISRMAGMSFFGMLICFSILMNEYKKFTVKKNLLLSIIMVNILCPSYNVLFHLGFQSFPGLYQLISVILTTLQYHSLPK